MKILAFSDIHCHNYSQFATRLESGLNSRLVDCLNCIKQVETICKEREIKHVVFAGDMFKSRAKIDVDVFTETWHRFESLSEFAEVKFLVGNHDQFTRIGDINCLEPFRNLGQVIAYPKTLRIGDYPCYGIPYTVDYEELLEAIARIPYDIKLLFMHQTLKEAIPGPDDNPGKPKFKLSDINWDRVEKVISGDIHRRQDLHDGRWHYLGSPLQLTFGDKDQFKGISIIDMETLEVEGIELDSPKFYHFTVTEGGKLDVPDFDFCGADPERDFIRIKYLRDGERLAEGLKIRYPRIIIEKYGDPKFYEDEMAERIVGNDRALLEEYMELNPAHDLDKERLLEFGMNELLTEIE